MDEQLTIFEPNLTKKESTSSTFDHSKYTIIPELQIDEKEEQKARLVLAKIAENYTEDEIFETITEIKFLTESWLNDFEREIFEGKTLYEMLHDKGGV